MSNKLPFEDVFKNKMNDLPAGDEDASWQKMKQLLEEKDKRKPFAWVNIYTVCSCIVIIAGLGICIILSNENNKQKNTANIENNSVDKTNKITTKQSKPNENISSLKPGEPNKTSTQKIKADTFLKQMNALVIEFDKKRSKHISLDENNKLKNLNKQPPAQKNKTSNPNFTEEMNELARKKEKNSAISATNLDSLQNVSNTSQSTNANNSTNETIEPSFSSMKKNDSLRIENNTLSNLNSSSNVDTTSIKKQQSVSLRPKKYFIEAGLQLRQQIPIGGQKIMAYNYRGNKNLFKDYTPSLFIRFEKDRRWFLQGEFCYAAPHFIKQFLYSQQTKVDYSLSTITVTTASLQKTYYTQLPLSFNYYLQPHWSIGTGIIFNWFHGAVAEKETKTNDIKNVTYSTIKTTIPIRNFTDSFLYKNQLSLLLQTGYSLKRWSLMVRYETGIQPYIKYTLPDGTIESRKKSSVELNISYRFTKKPF